MHEQYSRENRDQAGGHVRDDLQSHHNRQAMVARELVMFVIECGEVFNGGVGDDQRETDDDGEGLGRGEPERSVIVPTSEIIGEAEQSDTNGR